MNPSKSTDTTEPGRAKPGMSRETLGLWLGLLGVIMFAITLPMTRMATGTTDAPQLSPWFVTFGRAVLAGALSWCFCWSRARPGRACTSAGP
jgi:drug/metabolite transporter (DMT)-like permease